MIVVVIVPVVVTAPPAALNVPPPVVISPAAFPCYAEFMPPVIRLPAVVSMMLDSLVKFAIRLRRAPLAIAIVRSRGRRSREQEHGSQRRRRQYPPSKGNHVHRMIH
jgi:hypothetical protein